MTIEEFGEMVKNVQRVKLMAQGPDYSLTPGEKSSTVFRRSIFAVRDIEEGEVFSDENIRVIRPGYGVAPKYLNILIGRKSSRSIRRGEPIILQDLD